MQPPCPPHSSSSTPASPPLPSNRDMGACAESDIAPSPTVDTSAATPAINPDKRKSKRLRSPLRRQDHPDHTHTLTDPDVARETKLFKPNPLADDHYFVSPSQTNTSNIRISTSRNAADSNPSQDDDLVSTNPNASSLSPTRNLSAPTPRSHHLGNIINNRPKSTPMTIVAATTSTSVDTAAKIQPVSAASSSALPATGAAATTDTTTNNRDNRTGHTVTKSSDAIGAATLPADVRGGVSGAEVISDVTPSSTGSNSVGETGTKKKGGKASAKKKSKDDKWLRISEICDQENILWSKVKGHPYWPTQVVRLDQNLVQEERFKTALKFKRKGDDTCVMYFGTCEVAWINVKKIAISWKEGIKKDLHNSLKARPTYQTALKEVLGYCAKATLYPRGWWCEPKCFSLAHEFLDIVRSPQFEGTLNPFCDTAENERVCWARMRGYPFWPVQVLPLETVEEYYPELKFRRPKEGTNPKQWPCMFFGTGEVALIGTKQIKPFITGVRLRFWMNSDRNDFIVSMGEMWGYMQEKRIWPSGYISSRTWWNFPAKKEKTTAANEALCDIPNFPKFDFIRRSVQRQPQRDTYDNEGASYSNGNTNNNSNNTSSKKMRKLDPEENKCNCNGGGCRDDSCLNVASRVWCDPDNCSDNCLNKPFWLRKQKKISPFYTADQRGWGLRLDEKARSGDFITEYVGELINKDELARRLNRKNGGNSNSEDRHTNYYIMDTNDEWFLDAEFKGNYSRFINSSCEPNCESQKWMDPKTGITHVGIFALKDIHKGTEVTYNYRQNFGFGYQIDGSSVNRKFVCRCRSDTCCMLDPAERDWVIKCVGKRIRVKWDDGWYTGKVDSYDQERKKFTILYDDGDDEELTLGLPTLPKSGDGVQFKFIKPGEQGYYPEEPEE